MYNGHVGPKCCVRHGGSRYLDERSGEALCMSQCSKTLVSFISDWEDPDLSCRVIICPNQIDVRRSAKLHHWSISVHCIHWRRQGCHQPYVSPFVCWWYADARQGHHSVNWYMLSGAWDSHIVSSTLVCCTASSAESRQDRIHMLRVDCAAATSSHI